MMIFFLVLLLANNLAFCSNKKSNALTPDTVYQWNGSEWAYTTPHSPGDDITNLTSGEIYRFYYTSDSSIEPQYTAFSPSSTLKNVEFSEVYSDVMEPEFESSGTTRTSPFIVIDPAVTDFTMSNVILRFDHNQLLQERE
ncbi:MAG: hypothetical protein EZS28_039357 [Streblomastix strix]|uniref:Uncharacterized protein n=1 Tax=Streblomastix strix TaxID=222440 RepID=A0A5J4U2V3_9EUKA|nr:MAG: hypothetical protein EZS28_039357 [Streblomastix strix]